MRCKPLDGGDLIEALRKRIQYDPLSGKCFWIIAPKQHPRLIGKEAGCLRRGRGNQIRHYIKVNGKAMPRARVAFMISFGRIPGIIDHINGNPTDDRIENLREATSSQNNWNVGIKWKPNGLPTGVRRCGELFQARIACHKETKHLGSFGSIDAALRAYIDAKKVLHGEYSRRTACGL